MAYFRLADTGNLVRETDRWLRRRLRQIRWKEWKSTAAKRHNLRIRGISELNVRKMGREQQGTLAGCGLPDPRRGPCPTDRVIPSPAAATVPPTRMDNGASPQPDEACACGLRFAK